MKQKLFFAFAAVLLVGCMEPCPHYNRLQVATFYGSAQPVKKPYGTVVPFYTADDIKRPYEAIGFMSCEGSVAEEAGILKAMLYRAADMGADGILLNPGKVSGESVEKPSENINFKMGWMAMIGNSGACAYRAQAIRFKTIP